MPRTQRINGYRPEEPVVRHVRGLVRLLLDVFDPRETFDADHITTLIMGVVPEQRLGSIKNRTVAAAATWETCRVCGGRPGSGVPAWQQKDVAIASGVSAQTIRVVANRLRAAEQ